MEKHSFQVNLGGIIDILANHLYSDESVFVRELLQNATDAITARQKTGEPFEPSIEIELINEKDGPSQLVMSDNGIGLTEAEVHAFLSVIGASSKKDDLLQKKEDFIGQFGIGLLSCFVVADEIVMITRSASGAKAVEWRGKSDGTYSIRLLDQDFGTGTRVFLTAKPGQAHFFEKNTLKELVVRYGNFLKYPILLSENGRKPKRLNRAIFPWEKTTTGRTLAKAEILAFGAAFFEMECMDCIPLFSPASNTTGYAFIGTSSFGHQQQQNHSVYLHRIFLSDKVENILPEWVFFAKCIINSTGLRPTASRESFYEDKVLKATREELGESIISYFYELQQSNPDLLYRIIGKHHTAMKLAAISNDEFFINIHGFIPFETNYDTRPFRDLLQSGHSIKYVTDIDEFRKISSVALNQSIEIINAGYVYETSFFEKLAELFPDYDVQPFNAEELMMELKELELHEREEVFDFIQLADKVLEEYSCKAEMRHFLPAGLSAIYFKNDDMDFVRKVQKSKDVADELWGGILDSISANANENAAASICFNYSNPLVQKAAKLANGDTLIVLVKMLYVQSLLTGRHPLQQKEMNLLTGGLHYLIDKVTENNG
ncbi:MAG: HSP90 family protein [Bacteroidota bacterium]